MQSNAQNKTSGSKPQNKSSAPTNASKTADTKSMQTAASSVNSTKPQDNTNPQKLPVKNALTTRSANTNEPRLSQDNVDGSNGVGVNKKKQKRRQKEAARRAAEQPPGAGSRLTQQSPNVTHMAYQDVGKGIPAVKSHNEANGYHYGTSDYDDPEQYEPDDETGYYGNETNPSYQEPYDPRKNGHSVHDYISQDALGGKAKKKKKAKAHSSLQDTYSMDNPSLSAPTMYQPPPPPPPPPSTQHTSHRPAPDGSKDRIWNTSTAEERERIKEFWLSLGEEDRRSLVKVEKEAVLRKMKEQQKHSCSCTVCGRKRTAIEEELEVLYDAYYEELEGYANPIYSSHVDEVPPDLNAHSVVRMPPHSHTQMHHGRSSRGRIQELGDDDDEAADEEDYSEEDDDEEISEDEFEDRSLQPVPSGGTDFFNFGRSLTVQGGILTVADDLLKNDGKKFIEMMEQLAERRMQREEDQYARAGLNHPPIPGHNHNQPTEDEAYDDEEDDEEYDEDDEEYDEEDEMESMTELERMKEGRRMFQIFAARMFEQRVLTAYREKVALERQQKLLEELDDESRVDAQREAKKAKEAQKKKDKKRQQKEAKDVERAKREAEKAAEEAAVKALEEKRAEEVRQRKEEQRKKREAEKKSQEEEKQRKEAEKQRRLQEAKEQQAEQERKQRDQKDREKKKREELKKKEREEKEAREKEAREKKERDLAEKREREAKAKADTEAKERLKHDAQLLQKRQSPSNAPPTPMPPGLHPPATTSSHTSPRLHIATPVVPKAPTPIRARRSSFQDTHNISPKTSQLASPITTTSPNPSSGLPAGLSGKPPSQANQQQSSQTSSQHSPATISPGQPHHPPGLSNLQRMAGNPFPSTFGPPLSPIAQQAPHHSMVHPNHAPVGGGPYRNYVVPHGMPYPPGIVGVGQIPPGRGGMMGAPLPHISTGGLSNANTSDTIRYGLSRDNVHSQTHSRNTSASYDKSSLDTPIIAASTQPIARPAPIKRPSSVAPHQHGDDARPRPTDVDDLSNHLGSSALLDDNDTQLSSDIDGSRHSNIAPPGTRVVGQGFGAPQGFSFPTGATRMEAFPRGMQTGNGNTWSASQQSPFGAPPLSGPLQWSNGPGFGRANNGSGFGSIGGPSRPNGSRAVTIRLLVRTACEKLTAHSSHNQGLGWHHADEVLREVQAMKPGNEAPVHMLDMLDICDTEGNGQNGGGSFVTRVEDQVGLLIRFDPGRNTSMSGRGAGDIGSPIVGNAAMSFGGQRPFQQPGGF